MSLIKMTLFSGYNQQGSFVSQSMKMLPEKTTDCHYFLKTRYIPCLTLQVAWDSSAISIHL